MGLFNWLKALFAGSRRRDVSGLEETDADWTEEVVDTSAGPWKPKQHRLALRDKRLLPKPKRKIDPRVWPLLKRSSILSADEASRLFSDTMRTRDRNIRDLATDEQQLQRYQLPIWKTESDVAAALGITTKQLRHYSIHRQRETSPHYVAFAIPKRSGGHRIIHAPKRRLKALQRQLDALLVSKLPVSGFAHGFRSGRSVASNAEQHVCKSVVIKLDIRDCFPTIHYGRVRGLLISLGYSYPVATTLSVLMTEAPRQPVEVDGTVYHVPVGPRVCVQGAPTSPGLCNSILMRLDRRIAGLARKLGFSYTRYADDLTLSGNDRSKIKQLISLTGRISREEGFQLNSDKTRVLRKGQRQRVTGVIVNEHRGLSRVERRRLRAEIHQFRPGDELVRRRIEGKIAYLKMLNPQQAAPLEAAFLKACSAGS